ncbi:MAG: carboxynorspermidine decarboxylase [Muribaculaceae bacterium]|nr:carboxynorspermidine decarboxylase [Muribaculaceae bacterium]
MMKPNELSTPYYIVYEDKLRRNLELITYVSKQSGAKIIMAFKANALWRTFEIIKEYCRNCTASSVNELRLGKECLGGEIHTYSPAYTDSNIDEYLSLSTHITFNSLSQWKRFGAKAVEAGVSAGLRVNPKCSVIDTDLYNPAKPGSRFGVSAEELSEGLPHGIEGLHFHALCESSSYDLEKVLAAFESKFGHLLANLKWVNFGGGHLMTREGYDTDHLIKVIRDFRSRYPHLEVIMEPGSAFTWQTGDLVSSVVDVVEDGGIPTAILDVSFACHMPDTLEMPYLPAVEESVAEELSNGKAWRLGGNSCLSGDFKGDYFFAKAPQAGDIITLKDMNHYTTVKTTMFNGIPHPDIVLCRSNGECEILRHFDYNDYKNRMS